MKLILGFLACVMAILPVSRADNSTLSSAIASLPSCAVRSAFLYFVLGNELYTKDI
jgi:hypothetical protein